MRVKIVGNSETAKALRGQLAAFSSVAVVEDAPDFTIRLEAVREEYPSVDSIDSPLEGHIVKHLAEQVGHVLVKRRGGNQLDDTIIVGIPEGKGIETGRAIFRALTDGMLKLKKESLEIVPEPPEPSWWKRHFFILVFLLLPITAQAQQTFLLKCHDGTTSFWCADAANTALRVNCVAGCVAGGSFLDAAAFTFGTTPVSNTAFVVDDVATNTVAENSAGAGRMSTNRIPYFSLHSDAGTALGTSTNGLPIINGNIAESTAAWTSATGLNTTLRLTVTGYNSVTVTLNQGTTITAGVVTFEASDTTAFTNAYPINCGSGNTYVLQPSINRSFTCSMGGLIAVQVRLSTQIVGSGTVNVGLSASANVPALPTPAWPAALDANSMSIHGEDNLRFKMWNSAGCLNSLQTCETVQTAIRIRFRRKSDPATELVTTKILTMDNDRAASTYLLSGGFGNFAFGAAAGRGRTVNDADSPGTAVSVTTVTAGNPATITTAAHGFPVGQIVTINISGVTTTPSANGPWNATVASSTTFTIPLNVTSGCTTCGGTFYSSILLNSATAAFVANDVGKAITLSVGGVQCGAGDYICQGPKMPGTVYQGEIIALISGTQVVVKPSILVDPAGTGQLIIEPTLLADSDGKELGDGWLTNVDQNFWGGGQFVGQTYSEGEINNVKDQTGTAFTHHAGWKLWSDYLETSYHLAWPGSHTTARHKVGDTHGWTRSIVFGTTGGQNALTITANSLANPTIVTTAAHGMSIGTVQLVTISGTNSTPVIDGLRYATVLSATTFSVPVNVTVAGTTGSVIGPYATPAAGADWIATVPLGAHWKILGCRAVFTASSTATTRAPSIIVDDGVNQIYQRQVSAGILASETHAVVAGPATGQGSSQGPLGGWTQGLSFPTPIELTAAGRIRSSTSNIQAGDQWSAVVCQVEEWIEQGTSGVGG